MDQRERPRHLGEDRRPVGRIDPERLEGLHRVRVHRLGDEEPAGPQRSAGELEQALKLLVGEVLDHVHGGDRAEASFRLPLEVGDGVRLLDRQPLRAGALDHALVRVHAASVDAGLGEQLEQLAPAAAEVEHRLVAAQQLDVRLEQPAHALLRPAEDVLEGCVGTSARPGGRAPAAIRLAWSFARRSVESVDEVLQSRVSSRVRERSRSSIPNTSRVSSSRWRMR